MPMSNFNKDFHFVLFWNLNMLHYVTLNSTDIYEIALKNNLTKSQISFAIIEVTYYQLLKSEKLFSLILCFYANNEPIKTNIFNVNILLLSSLEFYHFVVVIKTLFYRGVWKSLACKIIFRNIHYYSSPSSNYFKGLWWTEVEREIS